MIKLRVTLHFRFKVHMKFCKIYKMKTLGHKDIFLLVICGSSTINLGTAFNFNLLELGKNKIQLTILLLVLGKNKTLFKCVLWCYCLNLELLSVIALTCITFFYSLSCRAIGDSQVERKCKDMLIFWLILEHPQCSMTTFSLTTDLKSKL